MVLYVTPKSPRPVLDVPMKPLLIPLRSVYFEQFKEGTKTHELRKSGGKWNPKTCPIGRDVILSKGYGRKSRLRGWIIGYADVPVSSLRQQEQHDFKACYGDAPRVFIIDIEVEKTND